MLDWNVAEAKLCEASLAAIKTFGAEHGDELICFFAFDSEPRYGYVLFAFDTFQNNLRSAQELEQFVIKSRNERLTQHRDWTYAKHYLTSPPVSIFHTNCGDFAYPQYAEIEFPEWEKLAKNPDYPKGKEFDDDYLNSNVRILFWNVTQRLVADNAFRVLTMASPFMVGYGLHDEEEQILRVLNWPVG